MKHAREDYNDKVDSSFFINKDGCRGFDRGASIDYENVAAYEGKGDILTIFNRKIILIAPEHKKEVQGNRVTFRWKGIRGVKHYLLTVCPIQHPLHPQSRYSAEIQLANVLGTELTVTLDDLKAPIYLHPSNSYVWLVQDSDDKETDFQGHVAQSEESVLVTHGGWGAIQKDPSNSSYMHDEEVEAKLGMLVEQPYQPSDYSPVWLQIVGLGRGPALEAGLQPHDEIRLANGKSVKQLGELHSLNSALPKGASLFLTIKSYDSVLNKWVEKVIPL